MTEAKKLFVKCAILEELKATSSTLEKQRIIAKYKDTTFISDLFIYTYSPYKTFGLKFSSNQIREKELGTIGPALLELLDELAARRLTGKAAREAVNQFALDRGDLVKLICNKDLCCGVAIKLINKAFGYEVIPSFKVQLAKAVELDKIEFPTIAQLKYNGTRCVAIINDGRVTFKTRRGHSFSFPELEKAMMRMPNFATASLMLDGELTFGDSQNEDHTKVNGLVNSARQGTPIVNPNLVYHVFDTMKLDDFTSCCCNELYTQRFNAVVQLVDAIASPLVQAADSKLFYDVNDLLKGYKQMLADGYEGYILKSSNHLYSFKRSKDWAKMKAELSADLVCVEVLPGEGKYEDCIGSLRCEGYLEDQVEKVFVEVKVGSGLTDADRNKDPSIYLDKTIEVKYNTVIANKNNLCKSLFLPRFVCVRGDK